MIDLDTLIAALRDEGGGLANNAADDIVTLRQKNAERLAALRLLEDGGHLRSLIDLDSAAMDAGDDEIALPAVRATRAAIRSAGVAS